MMLLIWGTGGNRTKTKKWVFTNVNIAKDSLNLVYMMNIINSIFGMYLA